MQPNALNFTALIRQSNARIVSNNIEEFRTILDDITEDWYDVHGRRASFNWVLISEKLTAALGDIVNPKQTISSHDLLSLHEHLNRIFKTTDNSVSCSDACQVALNIAIKTHYDKARPIYVQNNNAKTHNELAA